MQTKTIDQLIQEAESDARSIHTVTRGDGTTFRAAKNYGMADNGRIQVYVVPVTARTVLRKEHFRATFYILQSGQYKRVSKKIACEFAEES